MREKIIVGKILIIITLLILVAVQNIVCAADKTVTKMQIINEGTAWNNISISQSYTECESLNDVTSTLATTHLRAHLTTDYDWSAMAILSISQYGASTTNAPTSTTGNNSGVRDLDGEKHTTTLVKGFSITTAPFDKLYDSYGNLKEYINLIDAKTGIEYDSSNNPTGRIAISYVSLSNNGGTKGWFGEAYRDGQSTMYPVGIRSGLFVGLIRRFLGTRMRNLWRAKGSGNFPSGYMELNINE